MRSLLLLPFLCLAACQTAGADSYLGRLSPVVLLRFDQEPGPRVGFPGGVVLSRAPSFNDMQAVLVRGPRSWTGGGWDFSACKGPYLLKVSEAMARVGDIRATDGMTVSFWCRGKYSGRVSRIMAGPFDIGSQSGGRGIWGGTNDYQNAQMDRGFSAWDGQWHHVAVVADFRAKRNNVRIYLDGIVAGTRHAVYTKNVASGVRRTWAIGARNAADPGFDYGALADIAVFDRALSEHEILYIGAGPVYAGQNQEVVLPNTFRLDGFAPVGKPSIWSQEDGPATATVVSPRKQSTEVRVPEPGQYRFKLTSAGVSSSVQVKVVANQPPLVFAGDGMVLSQGVRRVRLKGTAVGAERRDGQPRSCHRQREIVFDRACLRRERRRVLPCAAGGRVRGMDWGKRSFGCCRTKAACRRDEKQQRESFGRPVGLDSALQKQPTRCKPQQETKLTKLGTSGEKPCADFQRNQCLSPGVPSRPHPQVGRPIHRCGQECP